MENKIWKFVDKYKIEIFIVLVTILGFLARFVFINFQSDDYIWCLSDWNKQMREMGGFASLSKRIGDYNVIYMFILTLISYLPCDSLIPIKLISIVFDFVCAIVCMKMTSVLLKDNKNKKLISAVVYSIVVFLPTVILNSSKWGQCDSIYTAFVLLALLKLIEKKDLASFIYLGIAFIFKLQAIFVLPVYILIYMSERRFPLYYFTIPIVLNIVSCLPAIIAGRPVMDCITIYSQQVGNFNNYLTMNLANIFSLIYPQKEYNLIYTHDDNNKIDFMFIIITIFIFIIIALFVLNKKLKFDSKKIIEFSLLSIIICTFLLPKMHDRYLYIADILSIIYALLNKDKFYIPICISLISLNGYSEFLDKESAVPIQYFGVLFLAVFIITFKDIWNKYLKLNSEKVEED